MNYLKNNTLNSDIQDNYYIDFEVMKKIIGLQNTKFSKIDLIEEVKHNYNEQTNDIMDFYVYLQKKPKISTTKKIQWKKIYNLHKKIQWKKKYIIYRKQNSYL